MPALDRIESSPSQSSPSLASPQVYWNAAAETYERDFTGTVIGQMWRESVWREMDAAFHAGSHILELNCGTGIDAIHLAGRGVSVLGCDISSRMIELAQQNACKAGFEPLLDFRVLPTEDLALLRADVLPGATFDGAFSNFSGLNCVDDLAAVRRNLAQRIRPGSPLFLCMLGRFNLWGRLKQLSRANFKEAFRVVRAGRGIPVNGSVTVRYPSSREIEVLFSPDFKLRAWKGIGIVVPPAYMERWVIRVPGLARILNCIEQLVAGLPGIRSLGACILLEFERTTAQEMSHAGPEAKP